MAKKKTEKEYQEWIEDVMGKMPEELQPHLKQIAESPVGMELFGGHLREQEFHRRLSEINEARKAVDTERQALETGRTSLANDVARVESWVKTEVPKFNKMRAERDALKAQLAEFLGEEPTPGGLVKTNNTESNDELMNEVQRLRQQVAYFDATVPAVLADFGTVLYQAQKDGFEIDPRQLIDHSMQKTGSLTRSFEELTADQRKAREEKRYKDEIEKAKEEARREILSQSPTPDRFRLPGPTPAELRPAPKTQDERVGAAVAEWNKALQENPSSLSF